MMTGRNQIPKIANMVYGPRIHLENVAIRWEYRTLLASGSNPRSRVQSTSTLSTCRSLTPRWSVCVYFGRGRNLEWVGREVESHPPPLCFPFLRSPLGVELAFFDAMSRKVIALVTWTGEANFLILKIDVKDYIVLVVVVTNRLFCCSRGTIKRPNGECNESLRSPPCRRNEY